MGIWPNLTGLIPGWSPTKIVQMVLIGCISRSQSQKLGFQNAIFKNLVWNYKAQSFHIWCITSSRGPLPIFGGQHQWSTENGSTVTFDLFLRCATQGPLGPLVLNVIGMTWSGIKPMTSRSRVLFHNMLIWWMLVWLTLISNTMIMRFKWTLLPPL